MSESSISWGASLTPDELAARLKNHPFRDVREQLMTKITFVALGHAQTRTPVRTGTLRRSETTRVEAGGLRGFVGTNIKYAPFVHNRVPFFEQAITDSRGEVQQLLQDTGDAFFKGIIR